MLLNLREKMYGFTTAQLLFRFNFVLMWHMENLQCAFKTTLETAINTAIQWVQKTNNGSAALQFGHKYCKCFKHTLNDFRHINVILCVYVMVCVQMYLVRVSATGQDVQQVSRGDEVEAWEGQALGVQILCQGFFTKRQSARTGEWCHTLNLRDNRFSAKHHGTLKHFMCAFWNEHFLNEDFKGIVHL